MVRPLLNCPWRVPLLSMDTCVRVPAPAPSWVMAAAEVDPPNWVSPTACPGVPRFRLIVWVAAPAMPDTVIGRVAGETSRPLVSNVTGVGGTVTVAPGMVAVTLYVFTPVLVNTTLRLCGPLCESNTWMPVVAASPMAICLLMFP